MKKITMPDGTIGYLPNATDEEARKYEAFMQARHRFVEAYLVARGWPSDLTKLTIDQILEIRGQPGWKTPEGVEYQETTATFVPVEHFN